MEYISREAVLKKLQMQLLDLEADQDKGEYSELCENRGARDALDEAIYDIRTLKTADVQPVKHGKWEEVTDYGGWGDTHYRCSVCGEEWYLEDGKPKDNNMNFCPRCGARMDGEQND